MELAGFLQQHALYLLAMVIIQIILAGARAAYERALQIRREFLGENHPRTVMVRNKLHSL